MLSRLSYNPYPLSRRKPRMKLFRIEGDCYLSHEAGDFPAMEGQLFAAADVLVLPTPIEVRVS